MTSLKVFWRDDCPRCPAAKELGANLKDEGLEVINYNMDTVDGLAEAAFHSVMALPTVILVDSANDCELAEWRGDIPSVDEVKQRHNEAIV